LEGARAFLEQAREATAHAPKPASVAAPEPEPEAKTELTPSPIADPSVPKTPQPKRRKKA
ncbi:MAG: hypothetical protein HY925_14435, partial [Elusimicrobia bacterium]|nr:hypothetical protein [Elusimicrobiota bacterium]